MSQYLELFNSESREIVTELSRLLVELERNPDSVGTLNEIFRHIHTLKGISASLGFDEIVNLTHEMESVLDLLRNRKVRTDKGLVDLLLRGMDELELLLENRQNVGQPAEQVDTRESLEAVIQTLRSICESYDVVILDPLPIPQAPDMPEKSLVSSDGPLRNWQICLRIASDCMLKAPRAYIALRTLAELGQIPEWDDLHARVNAGDLDSGLDFLFLTDRDPQQVREAVLDIQDIAGFEMQPQGMVKPKESGLPLNGNGYGNHADHSEQNHAHRNAPTVRVSLDKLDYMMNVVGELIINKIRLANLAGSLESGPLDEALAQLNRLTDDLQDGIMQIRMIPLEVLLNRFPRMIRDLASEEGKEVDLTIQGADIGLDRTILDEINEPLVHILRNAVGHGLETPEERVRQGKSPVGTISLTVRREPNHVTIEVSDDGRGMDPLELQRVAVEKGLLEPEKFGKLSVEESLSFITQPGFSTRAVADLTSGRGIGMSSVQTKLESFGGILKIDSTPGVGSTFTLKLPLTMAVVRALLVQVAQETFAIPLLNISETIRVDSGLIRFVDRLPVVPYRDQVLPLTDLRTRYGYERADDVVNGFFKRAKADSTSLQVVVVEMGRRKAGLVVDQFLRQQEVVIKTLRGSLRNLPGIAGATILGNGKVGLIMDIGSII